MQAASCVRGIAHSVLEIELLGGFRMRHQGSLLDTVKPGKPQLLLAYLLLHREQWVARARVACALWPDSSDEQARTNLRRELHGLKQALPDGYLHSDPRQLAWLGKAAYRLDVAEFEAGSAESYGGELLPGYYAEWVLQAREQLAGRYRALVEKTLVELEKQGHWREATEAARRLVAVDPADEEAHRRLIRLHLAEGNRPRAEQALRECSQRLREELDVEVSQATLDLLKPLPQPTERSPLFGRERELAALRTAAGAHLTLLLGEPGIGKSRLLAEVEGSPRIYGRGYESERCRPFGPWLEALREHPAALALLRPEEERKGRDMIFDPLVDWMRGLAGGWVIMDDLQWFDEASLALLHYAMRVLAGHPIRWAAASRPLESQGGSLLHEFLRGLRRNRQLSEIKLQPLDGDTTMQLVAWAAPEASAEVARRSGGNPLFALELAHSDGQGLEASIRDRLEQVSGVAREIVSWGAALGRSFAPAVLERLLGRPMFELLPALEELEVQRIFIPLENGYDFAHDVVRELAYAQLTLPRRRLIHLQIARVLPEDAWPELARHASLAQAHELAAPAALTAARQSLRVLAFNEASAYARQGLEHVRQLPSQPGHWQTQIRLLQVEFLSGLPLERRPRFAQELKGLLELARDHPEVEAAAYEVLSALAFEGNNDAEVDEYSRRLAERAERGPAAEGARWLAHSGSCLASIGRDMHKAAALLGEAEELARRYQLQLVDIPLGWGIVDQHHGRWKEAQERYQHALELSRQLQEPWWRAQCLEALARLHLELDQLEPLPALAAELEEVVPRLGDGSEAGLAQALRALHAAGEADDEMERALASLRRADARRLLAFVCRRAAHNAMRWGRAHKALAWAQEGLQAAREVQHSEEVVLCRAALCELHFQAGEKRDGQEELRRLRREVRELSISALARQALDRLRTRWGGQKHGIGDGGVGIQSARGPG